MKKERKCIGVYIHKPSSEYQTELLKGIYRAAFEEDINVAVFSNVDLFSELEIFSLPNYEKLSGVIFVPYTFDNEETAKMIAPKIEKAALENNFPAVVIDKETDGIASIMCDDSDTMRSIIEHMTDEHGCRDIAFLTGPEGHSHAENRLRVFLQVMKEHGLPVPEDRIAYGDFWYNYGKVFVEDLIKSEKGLPEAIICANSAMGYSVYKALLQRGIYVPKDIRLACYSDGSELYTFITGAVKQVEKAGYEACRTLIDKINGGDFSGIKSEACGFKMNRSVSCGCIRADEYDLSNLVGTIVHNKDSYMSDYNKISTDLLNRKSYRELFWGIDWYSMFLNEAAGVYFCMREGWDMPDFSGDSGWQGYTDKMDLYYYRRNYEDGSHKSFFETNEYFDTSEMLPKIFDPEGKPSSYIFRSLNSPEKCFGYIVIDNSDRMQTYIPEFDYWIKDVTNALEAQYRLLNMRYLSGYDLMTGIYNRNAFNNMMPDMITNAARHKLRLFIALFDLNGMKYINDNFGHIEGDSSIKTAADIISKCKLAGADDERNFRIGGDEFIKAAIGNFTDEDIQSLRSDIEQCVKDCNETSGKAYPIYISIGICVKSPDDDFSLDSVLTEADKEMFKDKARLRKATGFNPIRKE